MEIFWIIILVLVIYIPLITLILNYSRDNSLRAETRIVAAF